MQWLVDRQLVLDEVNRYESSDSASVQVDAVFDELRRRLETGTTFDAALARFGFDQEGARRFRAGHRPRPGVPEAAVRVHPARHRRRTERTLRRQPGRFVRDGRQLSFDAARDLVQADLQDERRVVAIDAWLARLRRRAEVNELYLPIR